MTPLSPADVHALAVLHQGAPLPEFRGKGYRGEDGAHGVARATLESLQERELVELRLDGVWLITETGVRLLTDALVEAALQGRWVDSHPSWGQAGVSWGQAAAERALAELMQGAASPSITCPKCGSRSFNLRDIEERYCARCHSFHEDLAQGVMEERNQPTLLCEIGRLVNQALCRGEASPAAILSMLRLAVQDAEIAFGVRAAPAAPRSAAQSFFARTVPHAPPRFWPGAGPALPADRLAEIRAAHAEEVPEGTPPSRMAWHERHQQAHQHRGELLAEVLRLRAGGAAPATPTPARLITECAECGEMLLRDEAVWRKQEPFHKQCNAGGAAPAVQQAALDLEVVEDDSPPRHQRTPEQWLAGHDTTEACLRLGLTPPSPCLCDPCRYARRVLELEGAAAAAPRASEEPAQGAAPAAALRLTVDVTDPSAPVVHSSWPLDLSREQLAAARATVRSVSKTLLERLKEQQQTAAAGESTPALATTPSSGPSPTAEDP